VEDEWPPPEARFRSALWRAEANIERGEFVAAAKTLADVFRYAPERDRELVVGLHHLAAAGYKHREGDPERAHRQLRHARRRLEPYLPEHEEVDLAALLDLVERAIES
jgi:hypothetical protein